MNKKVDFQSLFPIIQEKIEKNDSVTFTAFGSSMHPFILGGTDRITLSPVTSPLKKGDIVFYRRRSGSFVLHRIVSVHGDEFYLCGDNQYIIETGISKDQIIAKLSGIQRRGKDLSLSGPLTGLWRLHLPLRRTALHALRFLARHTNSKK